MKKINVTISILLVMFGVNLFIIPGNAIMKDNLVQVAEDNILTIKDQYLQNYGLSENKGELIGAGIDGEDVIGGFGYEDPTEPRLFENLLGMAAFSKDFAVRESEDSKSWAEGANKIYGFVSNLDIQAGIVGYEGASGTTLYLENQAYSLEFLAESFEYTGNSDIFTKLEDIFYYIRDFEAEYNQTLHNEAKKGAYWTAVETGEKVHEVGDPRFDYPLTNLSLLVAAGSAHIAKLYRASLSEDKPSYVVVEQAIKRAENAISYVDSFVWNQEINMYNEDQEFSRVVYYAETQIYALMAFAHLFGATGKQLYLEKADLIIDSLMKYFWDSGRGGLFHSYSTVDDTYNNEKIKHGFDNALFAYALSQLAKVTGLNDKSFLGFWEFERPVNTYNELLEDVVVALNNNFYKSFIYNKEIAVDDGVVEGYIEWVNSTGSSVSIKQGLSNQTRLLRTNMLALYGLDALIEGNVGFVSFYQTYIIGVAISAGVVFLILILVQQKKLSGTKLSKSIKDLLSGEE